MNAVPQHTKITPYEFKEQGDFQLVNKLLQNPRYDIPEHLRKKVIGSAEHSLDSPESSVACKLAAARLILEADKRNLELIKLVIPKVIIHKEIKDHTTEELEAIVVEAYDKIEKK